MQGIEKLLPLLEEGTERRRINWERYSEHGTAALVGNKTVVMDWSRDEDGDYSHFISLRNDQGEVIESLFAFNSGNQSLYSQLEVLHQKAFRQSNKVDEVIDEVEIALRKMLTR